MKSIHEIIHDHGGSIIMGTIVFLVLLFVVSMTNYHSTKTIKENSCTSNYKEIRTEIIEKNGTRKIVTQIEVTEK